MSLGTALLLPVVHWGDLRCLPGFSGLSCPSQSRFGCPPLALVGYGHPNSSGVFASSRSSGGGDDGRVRFCLLLPHRVGAAWVQDLEAFSVIGWAWGPVNLKAWPVDWAFGTYGCGVYCARFESC